MRVRRGLEECGSDAAQSASLLAQQTGAWQLLSSSCPNTIIVMAWISELESSTMALIRPRITTEVYSRRAELEGPLGQWLCRTPLG